MSREGREIFRAAALAALTSPEPQAQPLHITSLRSWIALGAIGLLLLVLLLWAFFGRLPISLTGPGILVHQGGTFLQLASGSGVIADMPTLRVGDAIYQGQLLGRIAQPGLVMQLELAQTELQALQEEEKSLERAIKNERAMQDKSVQLETHFQETLIQANEAQLTSRSNLQKNDAPLSRERLIAAQSTIDTARSRLWQLRMQQEQNIVSGAERLRALRSSLTQAAGRYRGLQRQWEFQSEIISEGDGQIVELMAARGDKVTAGQPLLSWEKKERRLEALFFLPPQSAAKNIMPGMDVQIAPANTKKERDGFVLGKVISVAPYPATEQGMMAILHNADLVRELSRHGPPFSVLVALQPDPSAAGGYRWSAASGARHALSSGSLASAPFILERKRPIEFFIPWFKEGSH